MDFSKFSDDNFIVKDWINGVFQNQHDEKQREAYTATLVTKLQRYIQEVNKSLEDVSQQAVANLPRVLRDVDTLKQEASFLWQQMQQVKEEIRNVEQRTSHSMQVLVRVDDVRSRVEQACEALKEVDNWSSLASAMEDIFKSGDIEAIAAQLQSMRSSLQVLKTSPDYDDKVMHLEALKNRLETSLSPSIVAAFTQHNTEGAKRYFVIFNNLDRKTELRNYYLKCHRGRVSIKWQEIVSGEINGRHSAEQSDSALLLEFYELLSSVWHTEMQWCSLVFGKDEAASIVTQLLLEVTLSVESGPESLINNGVQGLTSEKLTVLTHLHTATYAFTQTLKKAIMNDTEKIDSSMLEKLSDAIWRPYIPHLLQYNVMEAETLLSALSDIQLDARDVMDVAQMLEYSVTKVFDCAQASLERCEKLTGFLGASDLIEALDKYFAEYCDRFARQLRTIATLCGLKKSLLANTNTPEATEDEEWTIFQHCVRVIATCGRLLIRFGDFHQTFFSSLSSHLFDCDYENGCSTPWDRYNYLKYGDSARYSRLSELVSHGKENSSSSLQLFPSTKKRFEDLNQQSHNLAFDVAFAQVRRQLSSLPGVISQSDESDDCVVSQSEMPMFSVSPSERATHIGQYLMTLPQHLEPFANVEGDSNIENHALEVALRSGTLPFPPKVGDSEVSEAELDNISDQWLGAIVRATENTYVEAVSQIKSLNANAARQLVADLDYMGNVIDSLGLVTSKQLIEVRDLLNVPCDSVEEFRSVAAKTQRSLSSLIANMRHINL